MLSCKYLGGHPSHPAPFTRAELAISGLGFVVARIDFENAQSTMAPAREVKTQVLAIPDDDVIALEADQTRAGFSIPLGGIFEVADDLALGVGGVIRTEGEGTLTLLLERKGERALLGFSAGTKAVHAFAATYQLTRVRAGRSPLPGLLEVDDHLLARRQLEVQEKILRSLETLIAAR